MGGGGGDGEERERGREVPRNKDSSKQRRFTGFIQSCLLFDIISRIPANQRRVFVD